MTTMPISDKGIRTVPNAITAGRLILFAFPIFYGLSDSLHRPAWALVWLCLLVVDISLDIVDGFIARRYHQVSDIGKLFDPLADKIITFTCLIWIIQLLGNDLGLLGVALKAVLVIRIVQDSWSTYLYVIHRRDQPRGSKLAGKLKVWLDCLGFFVSYWLLTQTTAQPSTVVIPLLAGCSAACVAAQISLMQKRREYAESGSG